MAGPCTVESPEMLFETARFVKAQGAHVLRGGAFKPSTSPYSFHGMGEEGLKLLAEARDMTGLPIITEVMDTRDVSRRPVHGHLPDRHAQYDQFLPAS